MKDQMKKAFDLAENEVEEKQIENLKNIIKNILQKKKDKEKEIEDLQEDVKILKQDIDDFKSGRLDKVKERHELDPKANTVAPIQITIINNERYIRNPVKPWYWDYEVVWYNPNNFLTVPNASGFCGSGTVTATHTTGTYLVNGSTISLN